MKKIICVMVLLMSTAWILFPEKVAVLPEVMKPRWMGVSGNQLYVAEESSISLFSLEDFTFVKSIGRKGEGPGEFKGFLGFKLMPDYLFISDIGRVLYFSRDGEFLKSRKTSFHIIFQLYPVGESFVGYTPRRTRGAKKWFQEISLYGRDMKFVKAVTKKAHVRGTPGKRKVEICADLFSHNVRGDKILVADSRKGFYIEVFDGNGEKLYAIDNEYDKIKITEEDKKWLIAERKELQLMRGSKLDPGTEFVFPEYFPAFRRFAVDGETLYVITWKKKDRKNEIVVMDIKGKILKKSFVDSNLQGIYTIGNHRWYALRDNVDTEEWELCVEDI